MEFNFKVEKGMILHEVLKIDNTLTIKGYEKNVEFQSKMTFVIDEMGKASAKAQGLKSPNTSAEKLINSDHVLYMLTEQNSKPDFIVVGFLKMGWKKLYLSNEAGLQSEAMVYCLIDFYVHESSQRKGYGKRLIEYMLQDNNINAKHLAIENPTEKLSQFMWKHYKLSKVVNQENDYVVHEEFFDGAFDEKNLNTGGNRALANKLDLGVGRHTAHKHHDTMGESQVNNQKKEVNPDFKCGKFKTNINKQFEKKQILNFLIMQNNNLI